MTADSRTLDERWEAYHTWAERWRHSRTRRLWGWLWTRAYGPKAHAPRDRIYQRLLDFYIACVHAELWPYPRIKR